MELASMLPGFRFLFTAIVLSMSILIFGLGAAALLRAAHEEFANLPSRRATPEPMFARLNDDPAPTLALLRVDPPVAEKPAENVPRRRSGSRRHPGPGRSNPGDHSGRSGETGGADVGRADAGRSGKAGNSGQGGQRGDAGRSGPPPRVACCRSRSEDHRHLGTRSRTQPLRLQLPEPARISRRSNPVSPRP